MEKAKVIMNNILSKETLLPVSFAIMLIVYAVLGEKRFNAVEQSNSELKIIVSNQQKQIDKLESQFMPIGELSLRLKQIEETLKEIKEKVK